MSDSVDVSALVARVERLEAIETARAALYRYAEGADTRNWEVLGSAFAPDAVMEMPGAEVRGREAIVAALRGMLPPEFVTRHLMTNAQAEWTGAGRVTLRSTVYYLHEGAGFEATGWGDYVDEIEVTDGVGVIVRKAFTPAQHLPGSIATIGARVDDLTTMELARAATWRYATAVDTVDLELLATVFTEDAVLSTRRGSRQGRDVVVDYYRDALADPMGRKHFLVNQKVTVLEPGVAEVESYFIYTYAGVDTAILGWGNYVDRVQVIDGVGYIAEKRISIDVHADVREGWAGEITP